MGSRRTGYVLCAVAAPLFALAGIVGTIAIQGGFPALGLAAFRTYGGAILLLPFVLLALRRFPRRSIIPIALYAAIGIVASQGMYFEAIGRMGVALPLVISYLAPLMVAVYQRLRLGERLPPYAYAAMVTAVGGVGIVVLTGSGGIGALPVEGLLLSLGVAITFAIQLILGARQPTEVGAFARAGASLAVASLMWLVLVPIWTLPFDVVDQSAELAGRIDAAVPVWASLVWLMVLGSAVPFALVLAGAVRIGAGAASMIAMIEPIAGTLLAWAVLGQALTGWQLAGIGIAVGGVAVVEQARIRRIRTVEMLEAVPLVGPEDR